MNMTSRDRKIILAIVPLVVVLAYWFLALGPKREEASTAGSQLSHQQQRRDKARTQVTQAESSKQTFAADYTSLVRLGKAVPTKLDMPSVLVQLESAARGTGIGFVRISAGERQAAGGAAAAQPPAPPGGSSANPAAAGGQTAQSAPGGAVEAAGNSVNTANGKTAKREGAGGAAIKASAASPPAGLDTQPLDLEFSGSFFHLADFFHRLKRFVRVVNDNVEVRGRLLTVEGLTFKADAENFPRLKATMQATVYLAPANQGATAGATPQGPAQPNATPASNGSSGQSPNPTATAAPPTP
jgi:hypothetical protein